MVRLQAPDGVAAAWRAWNGLGAQWPGARALAGPPFLQLRQTLQAQQDLVTQLLTFVETHPSDIAA